MVNPVTEIKFPQNCSVLVNFGKITETNASGEITKTYGDFTIKLVPMMENSIINAFITVIDTNTGGVKEIQQQINITA